LLAAVGGLRIQAVAAGGVNKIMASCMAKSQPWTFCLPLPQLAFYYEVALYVSFD
jgi:hypothetical protein